MNINHSPLDTADSDHIGVLRQILFFYRFFNLLVGVPYANLMPQSLPKLELINALPPSPLLLLSCHFSKMFPFFRSRSFSKGCRISGIQAWDSGQHGRPMTDDTEDVVIRTSHNSPIRGDMDRKDQKVAIV